MNHHDLITRQNSKQMKKIKLFALLSFVAGTLIFFSGCKKDPYKDVTSNERSIEAFMLTEGQIGPAVIDRTAGLVKINVLVQDGDDFNGITPSVQVSYKAQVSPASGAAVNFDAENKAIYTVTSESGQTRQWTVELVPFTETLLGTYSIQGLVVYGGTGVEYGGGSVIKINEKAVWPTADGPTAELDNTLTFTYTGATADGKTTGKVINAAGADGLYANFLFTPNPQTDVNNFYRKIPKGESTWTRDYTANSVTFTAADGTTSVATFANAGTEDLGNGQSKTIAGNSFVFTLNGVDDWGNIYSDYDKLVKHPRKYWIDVKRN